MPTTFDPEKRIQLRRWVALKIYLAWRKQVKLSGRAVTKSDCQEMKEAIHTIIVHSSDADWEDYVSCRSDAEQLRKLEK